MNNVHYHLLGAFSLIVGIILAVLGLKFEADESGKEIANHEIDNNAEKGYVAMIVIGFILIVFSFIFFIVGYRKTENEKMIL